MTLETFALRPSRTQLKFWEKLHLAKYRKKEGLFLAEGFKVVANVLNSDWRTEAILILKGKENLCKRSISEFFAKTPVYILTEKEWNKLSQDKTPEGIIAVSAIPQQPDITRILDNEQIGHLLLLYSINNPANLGAIVRTAHWFGLRNILLSSGSVDFTNPKVVRSAMGSLFYVTIFSDVDFLKVIPDIKKKYLLIGTDKEKGNTPRSLRRNAAILFGSESHGLPAELISFTNETWCIQGKGADSLSLPQAAAIMMYELTK